MKVWNSPPPNIDLAEGDPEHPAILRHEEGWTKEEEADHQQDQKRAKETKGGQVQHIRQVKNIFLF